MFLFYGLMFAVYGYALYILVALGVMADQNPDIFNAPEDELWQFIMLHMSNQLVTIFILLAIHLVVDIALIILMLLRGTIGENHYGLPHDYIDRDRLTS